MLTEAEFRRDLEDLKTLRKHANAAVNDEEIPAIEIELSISEPEKVPPTAKPSIFSKNPSSSLSPLSPANPLIDQQITIVKPTAWIDCISRESKRVFVQDKWIVARIALASAGKQAGLSELLLE
jgi:hypothetical protein